MGNVKLKKRLKKKNTNGRSAFYWPREISRNKNIEPGTHVICLSDAMGMKPKMVKVAKADDWENVVWRRIPREQLKKYTVLLEDLAE